jgi:hypothetical protein
MATYAYLSTYIYTSKSRQAERAGIYIYEQTRTSMKVVTSAKVRARKYGRPRSGAVEGESRKAKA